MNKDELRQWAAHLDRHLAAWARRTANDAIEKHPDMADRAEEFYREFLVGCRNGVFVLSEYDGEVGEVVDGR